MSIFHWTWQRLRVHTFRSLLSSWSSSGPLMSCLMKISLYSDRQSISSQTATSSTPQVFTAQRTHTITLMLNLWRGERWRSRSYLACWGRRTSLYFCCFCLSWIWAQGEILHYDSAWRNQTADPACKHTLIHWNTVRLHSISK